MHLRVIDFGVDKYGLNAWIYDSTNDGKANYDKVLFSRTKSAADAVGTLKKGEWADVKVKIARRRLCRPDGGDARQGRGADARPLAGPALPHVGQPRDRDRGRAGPASRASAATSPSTWRRSSRRRPPPTSRSSRPASHRRRPTPSRGCTGRPGTCRCSSTSSRRTSRTCCWRACRRRTSSSTSSSASSRRSCPAARRTRPTTTST